MIYHFSIPAFQCWGDAPFHDSIIFAHRIPRRENNGNAVYTRALFSRFQHLKTNKTRFSKALLKISFKKSFQYFRSKCFKRCFQKRSDDFDGRIISWANRPDRKQHLEYIAQGGQHHFNGQINVPNINVAGALKADNLDVRTSEVGDYRVYVFFHSDGQVFEDSWEFGVL